MRQVILDGRDGAAPPPLRDKLAGHFCARLSEYEEEGIHARPEGPGTVLARFSGLTGPEAVRCLANQGVYALAAGDGVRFSIGPGVAFEDLDYVQAVAASLLK